MESWSKCLITAPVQQGLTMTPVESVPAAVQSEIATILAGMALSYRQVECTE